MDHLDGKVLLVTGASAGIGSALCAELAHRGVLVFGCARNHESIQIRAEEVANKGAKGKIIPIECDVTNEEAVLRMFSHIRRSAGRLDVCINNAGLSNECNLIDGTTEQWRNIIEVNVLGLSICTREAVRLMKDTSSGGYIIHISSMSGHRIPDVDTSHMYVATKHMVRILADGLRRELTGTNIRVACVSPGLVETEFEYRCFKSTPEVAKEIYTSIKCMQTDDIVRAVLFILNTPDRVNVQDILMRPTQQVI